MHKYTVATAGERQHWTRPAGVLNSSLELPKSNGQYDADSVSHNSLQAEYARCRATDRRSCVVVVVVVDNNYEDRRQARRTSHIQNQQSSSHVL